MTRSTTANESGGAVMHDWAHLNTFQWGAVRGCSPQDAMSRYECKKCGAVFAHRYNVTPNMRKAIEEAGISSECEARPS